MLTSSFTTQTLVLKSYTTEYGVFASQSKGDVECRNVSSKAPQWPASLLLRYDGSKEE